MMNDLPSTSTSNANGQEDLEVEELEKLFLEDEDEDFNGLSEVIPSNQNDNSSHEKPANKSIGDEEREKNLLALLANEASSVQATEKNDSLVRAPDLDSSDDEDVRNFLERKYNEYGRDIKNRLKTNEEEIKDRRICHEVTRALSNNNNSSTATVKPSSSFTKKPEAKPTQITKFFDKTPVFTDPVFGMRIKNPLISSTALLERMKGRLPVSIARIRYHTEQGGDKGEDWVIAGAIISKAVKESKKGAKFSIWKISDLRNEIKLVTVFLFKAAHNDLWKTPEGMVVAILNPGIMDRKDEKKEEAVISVDTAQKIMLLGQSKDLGKCRSKTKNGDPCPAIVNLTDCEYCKYHVKQEYGKASRRMDLQSATAGRGLNELRNKVLGKSEVFYGGQSYTAIPAKKNPKQVAKDQHRLMTLSEYYQSPNGQSPIERRPVQDVVKKKIIGVAERHDFNVKQRQKDLARLALLDASDLPSSSNAPSSSGLASPALKKSSPVQQSKLLFDEKKSPQLTFSVQKSATPRLSKGDFTIDLSMSNRQADRAKQKAIQILQRKPIEKIDPNFIRHRGTDLGKKRALEELDLNMTTPEQISKKAKLDEEEKAKREHLLKIINATSSHTDLLEIKEKERQDKYFSLLEKKEAMEEKMMTTTTMSCKAVICLKCKYVAFSAADICKEEGHPLKIKDAEKRFFKCHDCGNRTVSLQRIPKLSCKNCQGSRWERTSMMKEKGVKIGEQLSIRGDEETFIGNFQGNANLNLLVPE